MSTAVYVVMLDTPLVEMVVFEHCHKSNWISFFMPTSMKSTHAKCWKMAGMCYLHNVCWPRRFGLFMMWSVWNSVSAAPSLRNGGGGHVLKCSGLCSIDSWKFVTGFLFNKSVTQQRLWRRGTEFSYVTCILFTNDEISQVIQVYENDIPFHCIVLNNNWRM